MRSFSGYFFLGSVALAALPSLVAVAPAFALPVAGSEVVLVRKADLEHSALGARGLLGGGLAQAPPAATPAAPSQDLPGSDPSELDEVTVVGRYLRKDATTATKTDTPLIDIPQSIQVVPRQLLEDQKIIQFNDALKTVSGVFNANPTFASFSTFNVRGFNTNNIYRNGFRDGVNSLAGFDVASIERIEVLKGPGSVLYGQGELSGIINVETKRPQPKAAYAATFDAGNYGLFRSSLDFTGPLTADKALSYRLNAVYQNSKSFLDFFQAERWLVAPAFTWRIGSNTTLDIDGEFYNARQPSTFGLPAVGTVLPNPNGKISTGRFVGEPLLDNYGSSAYRFSYRLEHRFSPNWSLRHGFSSSHQRLLFTQTVPVELFPDGRTLLRVITGTTVPDGYTFWRDSNIVDTYLIGNFRTGPVEHKLVFGFDASWFYNATRQFNGALIAPLDLFNPVYSPTRGPTILEANSFNSPSSYGIYIQDQLSFSENLKLLLGLRYDNATQRTADLLTATRTSEDFDAFSPRVGLVWRPILPLALYGSFSRSFLPTLGTNQAGLPFVPERGEQFEAGLKADLLEGKLFTTLAYFDLTRQNVLTPDPSNPFFSLQTGEQNSRGVEFDLTGEPVPGWNLTAAYAYIDARITRDTQFAVGNRLGAVPHHSASLWSTYQLQEGSLKGLGFGLGLFYVGERTGDLANTFTLPGYLRTDAGVYYRADNVRYAFNFRNLFNVEYYESAGSALDVIVGTPFTVIGSVSVEF
ncbi:TonB-dependent siderophore receptor [Gloeobacter violaceus]|nr:TonB-dependent siderophore receptor [Gloeobacter violaceus]